MINLKEFAKINITLGIIFLFILLVNKDVTIPIPIIVMITLGYLCSAISCNVNLFSISVKHHKIVYYFIVLMGIFIIAKHYSSAL
jgi:hypothetical protein